MGGKTRLWWGTHVAAQWVERWWTIFAGEERAVISAEGQPPGVWKGRVQVNCASEFGHGNGIRKQ